MTHARFSLAVVVLAGLALSPSRAFAGSPTLRPYSYESTRGPSAHEDLSEVRRQSARAKLWNAQKLRALKAARRDDPMEIEELDDNIQRWRHDAGDEE